MAVLQKLPWYQQILQEGMNIGESRGLQIGESLGLLSGITMGLELKFGSSKNALIPKIRAVKDIEVLSRIIDELKTVQTLKELRQIYQRNNLI